MVLTREQCEVLQYTIRNSDTSARQVVIEHPGREGWKLAEGPKAEETSASVYRFRVGADPGKISERSVEEYHPQQARYQLTNLNNDQVVLLAQQGLVAPAMQEAFRRVLDQKDQKSGLETQLKSRQLEVEARC